jgi:hypothetical protein
MLNAVIRSNGRIEVVMDRHSRVVPSPLVADQAVVERPRASHGASRASAVCGWDAATITVARGSGLTGTLASRLRLQSRAVLSKDNDVPKTARLEERNNRDTNVLTAG